MLCVLVTVLLVPMCLQCCQYVTKLILVALMSCLSRSHVLVGLMSTLLLVSLLFINDLVLDARRQLHLSNNINNTQYVALVNSVTMIHVRPKFPDLLPRL